MYRVGSSSSKRPVRRALLLAVPLLFGACATASAQAPEPTASLPLCPVGEEGITITAPSTVRRGQSYSMTFVRAKSFVASFDVEFVAAGQAGAAPTATTETFTYNGPNEMKVVRVAPAVGEAFDLNVSWIQDPGTPAACRGYDRRTGIPIVAEGVTAGEPGFGRLQGKYRAARTDGTAPTWSLTPRCDLFACTTRLRSTGGLKGKLTFDPAAGPTGEYTYKERSYFGWCKFQYEGDDTTITWREFETLTIKLRPTKVVDGIATELRGIERRVYDIPSDDDNYCDKSKNEKTRVVVTLR